MWIEDYQWHYDYIRLAWDTGFSFEKCKSPNLDKNKICVVDVDKIVKERDVASVDRYISTVVQYILDDEQAKVLDTNFVKLFRISQLAVEYLLFCKKYLDNTVVLLKKELTKNREENKELKQFIDDLQAHVETLTHRQAVATFKCTFCSKVFASEDYLNSHVKRRHNNQSTETYNSDTDKLNTEIKELKERLNIAERLLKDKEEQRPEKYLGDISHENSKMSELLEKFESFKSQVDNDLKELKLQKSFYEENYGKLFDIVIQNKENIDPKSHTSNGVEKTETTTQTDKMLHMENVNYKNILEVKELSSSSNSNENEIPVKGTMLEKEKESLEVKISTTLAGIEGQMQAFWDKLTEIEQNKAENAQPFLPGEMGDAVVTRQIKPRAKPRSKLTQPSPNTVQVDKTEEIRLALEQLEQKHNNQKIIIEQEKIPKNEELVVVHEKNESPKTHSISKRNVTEDDHSDSETSEESESSDESESGTSAEMRETSHKAPVSSFGKEVRLRPPDFKQNQDILSPSKKHKNIDSPLRDVEKKDHKSTRQSANEKAKNLNREIEALVCNRLQELGISENWSRLPERSFNKALEMINHQATFTQKTYPNFSNIKKKINNEISKLCKKKVNSNTQLEVEEKPTKPKVLQNIVKVSYRLKSAKKDISTSPRRSPQRTTVEIKNRALYDTDTESDDNFKRPINTTAQRYSSVVDELKSKAKHLTDDESMDELNKDTQKGVLKSFPSVGSLTKKKVLFDLESESSKIEDAPLIQKGGGSTTSIASSILGEKVESTRDEGNDKEKKKGRDVEKDLDDLSDFDLSDIE